MYQGRDFSPQISPNENGAIPIDMRPGATICTGRGEAGGAHQRSGLPLTWGFPVRWVECHFTGCSTWLDRLLAMLCRKFVSSRRDFVRSNVGEEKIEGESEENEGEPGSGSHHGQPHLMGGGAASSGGEVLKRLADETEGVCDADYDAYDEETDDIARVGDEWGKGVPSLGLAVNGSDSGGKPRGRVGKREHGGDMDLNKGVSVALRVSSTHLKSPIASPKGPGERVPYLRLNELVDGHGVDEMASEGARVGGARLGAGGVHTVSTNCLDGMAAMLPSRSVVGMRSRALLDRLHGGGDGRQQLLLRETSLVRASALSGDEASGTDSVSVDGTHVGVASASSRKEVEIGLVRNMVAAREAHGATQRECDRLRERCSELEACLHAERLKRVSLQKVDNGSVTLGVGMGNGFSIEVDAPPASNTHGGASTRKDPCVAPGPGTLSAGGHASPCVPVADTDWGAGESWSTRRAGSGPFDERSRRESSMFGAMRRAEVSHARPALSKTFLLGPMSVTSDAVISAAGDSGMQFDAEKGLWVGNEAVHAEMFDFGSSDDDVGTFDDVVA